MSLQTTNLNVAPFFDDYDETKNFIRILYRPRPVQARELNQTQSILQDQINRVGRHLFNEGSQVIPGGVSTGLAQDSVGITFNNGALISVLNTYTGVEVYLRSLTTGLQAKIRTVIPASGTDPAYFFIDYISSGTNNTTKLFVLSEILSLFVYNADGTTLELAQLTVQNVAAGQWVKILSGVYFAHGYFVRTTDQEVVVSKNSITSTAKVGFTVVEEIVSESDDTSLYSNAFGYPNFKAAGAGRLKISLILNRKLPTDVTDSNFIEIASITNGALDSLVDTTSYSQIETSIAQRTYETNGDYTVNAFGIDIKEHLQDTNHPTGVYTLVEGGDTTKFVSQIKPGIAYVNGYRVQNIGIKNIIEDKARTTNFANNTVTSSDFGNYILVNNMLSMPIINIRNTFNLKNTGGTVIGTTRVASIRAASLSATQANSTYQIYIFDTKINNGYTFSNVASIAYSDGSNLFSASLVSAFIFNGTSNSFIFPLPYNYVKTLKPSGNLDTTYTVMREFNVTTDSSGNSSISTNANEIFGSIDSATYFISYTGASNTGVIVPVSGTLTLSGSPIGRGLSIALGSTHATKAIKIIASVIKTNPSEKTKTLTSYTESVTFSATSFKSLTKCDVYGITTVIDSNSNDVTANFTFDNGEAATYYAVGSLKTVTGGTISGTFTVTYQYFNHSSGDYFSVDSYLGMARENIPTFIINGTTYSLADTIDFRPLKDASGNITSSTYFGELLKPSDIIRADINYYLPRVDSIYVDSNGNFGVVEGVPADSPVAPDVPSNAMKLYELSVPAYTASVNDIGTKLIENKRYTMRDIGKLETRISNVEYYVSLNQLETSLSKLQVLDPTTGNNRFKNGFAADGFNDFSIANVYSTEFGGSFDFSNGVFRASLVKNACDFSQLSLTNGNKRTNLYTLPFTELVVTQQPYATTSININPYAVFYWSGDINLTPTSDYWIDTQYVTPKVINNNSTAQTVSYYANNSSVSANVFYSTVGTISVGNLSNVSTTSASTTTVSNTSTSSDSLISSSIIPYMRSIVIAVSGNNFRPYSNLYCFFDGVNVSSYCTPTGGILGGQLVTDGAGAIKFNFTVPDSSTLHFATGTSSLKLIDDISNNDDNGYTSGETTFTSGGTLNTRQVTIINTRVVTTNTVNTKTQLRASGNSNGAEHGGHSCCFIGGTQVTMFDGSLKNIEDVKVGDSVLSFDIESKKYIETHPDYLIHKVREGYYNLVTSDGTVTGVTNDHPFYDPIDKKWIAIDPVASMINYAICDSEELKVGSHIQNIDGLPVEVLSFEYVAGNIDVYTFHLDNINTYFANGLLTHNKDPLAQSFIIGVTGGAFVSKIDIFFKTKAKSLPVRLEIREMSNGLPTENIIPLGTKTLTPNQVNVSSDGSIATTFTFDDPVYLEQDVSYAMVLLTNTQEYNVYISEMGQTVLGQSYSVAKQPSTGVLFTSSNNITWNPNQLQDLKFTIWRCDFNTTVPAVVELQANTAAAISLDFNALTSVLNSNIVTMKYKSHGLLSGDQFLLAGAVDGNGFLTTNLNTTHTVITATIDTVTFQMSSNSTVSGTFGGDNMTAIVNAPFAKFYSNFNTQTFNGTSIAWAYKYKQQTSRTFTNYVTYDPSGTISLSSGGVIDATGDLVVQATLNSNLSNLSPVIDTDGATVELTDYRINSDANNAVYQYVTQQIKFNNPSTTARFFVGVYLPGANIMNVYYKPIYTSDDNLDNVAWVKLNPTVPVVNNSSAFVEYEYDLSGIGSFIGYIVKVQFLGSDDCNTPVIQDFRTIALA